MFAELGPQAVAMLCVAALAAGFVDAIAGGGGLITVPALLAAGVDPVSAIATNKVQGSVGTASATWTFWRAGHIELRAIRVALAMVLIGAVAGGLAVMVVDTRWLMLLLPVMLIAIALYFLLGPKIGAQDQHARLGPLGYGLVAGGIGFYDGFFGPGTGSFLIFLFIRFFGFDFLHASAASKIVNVATNLAAISYFVPNGYYLPLAALIMAVLNIVGSVIGTQLALSRGSGFVRKIFLIVVCSLIVKFAWDTF